MPRKILQRMVEIQPELRKSVRSTSSPATPSKARCTRTIRRSSAAELRSAAKATNRKTHRNQRRHLRLVVRLQKQRGLLHRDRLLHDDRPDADAAPDDKSLEFYVEEANHLYGATHLELKGKEIAVTQNVWNSGTKKWSETKKTIAWPANGLIYVKPNPEAGCVGTQDVRPRQLRHPTKSKKRGAAANVYVHGAYEKSLTVACSDDVIIDGSTYPSSVSGNSPRRARPRRSPRARRAWAWSRTIRPHLPPVLQRLRRRTKPAL